MDFQAQAISGGGSGSDGAAVNIPAWAIEEGVAQKRPDDSWSITEYMAATGLGRHAAITVLNEMEAAGKVKSGKYKAGQKEQWFYWPAPNPKRRP